MGHDASTRLELVRAYQRLQHDGFIYGSSGNISVRHDDTVWITPSGVSPEEITPDHICVVDLLGVVLATSTHTVPSSEVPLHLEIYRTTSAGAVVHAHSTAAVAAGLVTDEIPNVHYVMRRLGGTIRVAPYAVFGSHELAHNVTEALEQRSAALMRNHGAVSYGSTLEDAMESYRTLEWVCRVFLEAMGAGAPAVLSADQLNEVATAAETRGYRL